MTDDNFDKPAEHDPAFERRILEALKIEVPPLELPELPEPAADNVSSLPVRRRFGTPTWLAVAATVVVAAFLGFRMYDATVTYPSLADEIIAHLEHEPYALRRTDEPVSDSRLERVVSGDVARFDRDKSLITYANSCRINGKLVPHLVVQGERGPVTIILMPDEKTDAPQSLSGEGINGVLLPVGSGSIAIIGETGERLEPIEQNIRNSVMWST